MADPIDGLLESLKKANQAIEQSKNAYKQHGLSVNANSQALNANKSLVAQLGGNLRSMGSALGFTGMAVRGMMKGTMALTTILAEPIRMMQDLAGAIQSFVSLANPGVIQLFTLALNDAMAVIGRLLTPVLQGMTGFLRIFGDTLAKIEPVIQPIFDALGRYFANIALGASQVILAFAPLLQIFTDGMAKAIDSLCRTFAYLQGFIAELADTIVSILGLKGSSRVKPDATARNSAVRETRVQNVEDFAKTVFEKSLVGIFGGKKQRDPAELQAGILAEIKEGRGDFVKIKEALLEVAKVLAQIWDTVVVAIGFIESTATAAGTLVGDVAKVVSPVVAIEKQISKLSIL